MVRSMLHHDFNSSIIAELNCYTTPRKVLALVSRCPDRDLAAGRVREILGKKQVDERSEDKTNGRATHARALGCSP